MSQLRRLSVSIVLLLALTVSALADGEMGMGKDGTTPPPPPPSSSTSQSSTSSDDTSVLTDAELAALLLTLQLVPRF